MAVVLAATPTLARTAFPFEDYALYPSDSPERTLCLFAAAWRDKNKVDEYTEDDKLRKLTESTELSVVKIRSINTQSSKAKQIRCDVWTGKQGEKSTIRFQIETHEKKNSDIYCLRSRLIRTILNQAVITFSGGHGITFIMHYFMRQTSIHQHLDCSN